MNTFGFASFRNKNGAAASGCSRGTSSAPIHVTSAGAIVPSTNIGFNPLQLFIFEYKENFTKYRYANMQINYVAALMP